MSGLGYFDHQRDDREKDGYVPMNNSSIYSGKVKSIKKFAIFVELGNGLTGLLPCSEIPEHKDVWDLNSLFKVGDLINVIILSMKQVPFLQIKLGLAE